jgi:hypothetical protein
MMAAEQQQTAVLGLGAVDGIVVQVQPLVQRVERSCVAGGKALVEVSHRTGLLGTFFGGLGHASV